MLRGQLRIMASSSQQPLPSSVSPALKFEVGALPWECCLHGACSSATLHPWSPAAPHADQAPMPSPVYETFVLGLCRWWLCRAVLVARE